MTTKLTLDKAGRIVIPKKVRDQLHMSAGDAFEFKSTDDQIVLKPMRELTHPPCKSIQSRGR